jgi:hypothetical protein
MISVREPNADLETTYAKGIHKAESMYITVSFEEEGSEQRYSTE